MKKQQLKLFKSPPLHYGGKETAGRRKRIRPFDPKRPIHISLKSDRARGALSMLQPSVKLAIFALAHRFSDAAGVRLMGFENVGNHLHLCVLARKRAHLQRFLRAFAGQVAMLMTGAKKGHRLGVRGKFWTELAWSRVVNWGKDLLGLEDYFSKNLLESIGVNRNAFLPWARLARTTGPPPT